MESIALPEQQLYHYIRTGKFKAPHAHWKHQLCNLLDYELFVITEGTLYLSYGKEHFSLQAGEYLLLPPCNAWRDGFKEAYSAFYWLHFSPHDPLAAPSTEPRSKDSSPYFHLPQQGRIPKPEKMVVLMKQLQDSVKSNYPSLTLNAMTTCILSELYGQLRLLEPNPNDSPSGKQIYLDLIDYVQLNLAKNLKVNEIAEEFGYNEKYLSHLFKDLSGIPLKQYITQRKMEAANFLLTDSNTPIHEIAENLGFIGSHNFTRAYKNFSGLTPSEYRNTFAKRLLYDH